MFVVAGFGLWLTGSGGRVCGGGIGIGELGIPLGQGHSEGSEAEPPVEVVLPVGPAAATLAGGPGEGERVEGVGGAGQLAPIGSVV